VLGDLGVWVCAWVSVGLNEVVCMCVRLCESVCGWVSGSDGVCVRKREILSDGVCG